MTIGLGVLCDDSKKIVVAADRMLTIVDTEFEQDVRKIFPVSTSCVILTAGSALTKIDLIRDVKSKLPEHNNQDIEHIVTSLKAVFVSKRRQRVEEFHLQPLGLDYEKYINNQGNLSKELVASLTRKLENEKLGIKLLIAGVDADGGHLYLVKDPGVSSCFDGVGFCTIGSGERHAELTFIRSAYSTTTTLKRAIFLAYQAKRDAESAPGVGSRFTDVGIIDAKGTHFLSGETLQQLEELYKVLLQSQINTRKEIDSKIELLDI